MNLSICHPVRFYEDSNLDRLYNIAKTFTNLGVAHSQEDMLRGRHTNTVFLQSSLSGCYRLKYLQHLLIKSQ